MARKKDVVKKIDQKTKASGAPLPLIQENQPAAPAFHLIPAPDTLIEVSQAIQRSTQAPLVMVSLSWQEAPNIAPDYYNVEYSESPSFTNIQRRRAFSTSATIDGLKANGFTYYFRVQAVLGGIYSDFSETLAVVTMTDTTPPPNVSGLSGVFINGDLLISWTKPISEIFKDAEIRIYNAAHTILYATLYSANQQIIWTAEQNLNATSQVGATSVSIDVFSRSWANTLSAGVNTTATSNVPATPVGYASNWISDNGTASADLRFTWNPNSDADRYTISFDGVSFETKDVIYTYTYERNVRDHVPTLASGDPNIAVLLYAKNKLNQLSVPVNITVVNAAPPSGVISVQATPGFSSIGVFVTPVANTIVQDFDHYEYALTSGSTTIQTFNSPDNISTFQVSQAGTYGISVRLVDKFNQKSNPVTVAGLILDTLTIAQLRAETTYTDSLGASSPALDFLKDGLLTGSNKVYNAVASGTYQWIEAKRPLLDRYKTITFGATYAGITLGYYAFDDGSTIDYYAGPITVGSAGQKILTKYTVEATAKTNAIRLDLFTLTRYDILNIREARAIKVYFSNYGGNLTAFEYYPRRLVQSDDVDAENIRGINIAALAVTADKISVINLQAVSAQMGALHMDGVIDIVSTGGIYQGTGTFASPTTGLKLFNSSGVGKLSTYNAGVEQVTLDTDGRLKAGAGKVTLDATGIRVDATTGLVDAFLFKNSADANDIGRIWALRSSSGAQFDQLRIERRRRDGSNPLQMILYDNGMDIDVNGLGTYTFTSTHTIFNRPLNVGAYITPTTALSISGNTEYISFLTAAGVSKWLIGLEASGSNRLAIYNSNTATYAMHIRSSDGYITAAQGLQVSRGADANGSLYINGTTTSSHFMYSTTEDTYIRGGKTTSDVYINDVGSSTYINGNTSVEIRTSGVQRMGFGTGGNVGFFGANTPGGGAGVIMIQNRTTAPTTNPTNAGILYVEAGKLMYRGSSGTVTTIAVA
jgi:fibronectin type III domain protein